MATSTGGRTTANQDGNGVLTAFLDSDSGPDGEEHELVALLTAESGYEMLLRHMLLPVAAGAGANDPSSRRPMSKEETKRSFRAMSLLNHNLNKEDDAFLGARGGNAVPGIANVDGDQIENIDAVNSYASPVFSDVEIEKATILNDHDVLDHDAAGLVAKQVFQALGSSAEFRSHKPHLQKLLSSLFSSFPSAVVSAAVAGGPLAVNRNLSPLLDSDMSALVTLVSLGCSEENKQKDKGPHGPSSSSVADQRPNAVPLSRGNRRKFVRSLTEWGLMDRIVDRIVDSDNHDELDSESACDALFQIAKSVNAPAAKTPVAAANGGKPDATNEAPFGEDALARALGKSELVRKLLICACTRPSTAQGIASSRALMRTFTLATGRKRKKTPTNGAAGDNNNGVGGGNNRLTKWGVTRSMYDSLANNVGVLSEGIMASVSSFDNGGEEGSIPRFSSRRYCLVTVLADMLDFRGSVDELRTDALLERICAENRENGDDRRSKKDAPDTSNLFLYLTSLLFIHKENTLFHFQYYRIFFSLLRSNHEPSLRLLIQKSKFVSRSISLYTTKEDNAVVKKSSKASLRGIVLKCLNALRLQCQCLDTKSYLPHYLDSHGMWKEFQQQLLGDTSREQLPGLGLNVPSLPARDTANELDVGGSYANSLGFAGAQKYDGSALVENDADGNGYALTAADAAGASGNGAKKKKKGKKKKKK